MPRNSGGAVSAASLSGRPLSISHKQENAPGGNRTMHSVSYIEYVHLNAGNNDRGPVLVVAVPRRGADRPHVGLTLLRPNECHYAIDRHHLLSASGRRT
jgi:hypothetical protein